MAADGFTLLPISYRHGLRAGIYQAARRDRCDRMLAAQAEIESVPLVTLDAVFKQLEIITLWQVSGT